MISALLEKSGSDVFEKLIVGDNFEEIKKTIERGVNECDFVVMSGGSSVGAKDYTFEAISSVPEGKVLVHGLSVKPGKPTIIGSVKGKPVFGLPGHPVSAAIVYKLT